MIEANRKPIWWTTTYPPALQALLAEARVPPLGPGQPNQPMRTALASLTIDQICAPSKVIRPDLAKACLAGLWLHHDFLDESHAISQDLDTPEGSYWHAIMHRREPDASNAKYWFRRVGPHPVLKQLAEQAPSLGCRCTNPFDFVDFCEKVRDTADDDEELARKVQLLEWQLLFDHCHRLAAA